MSSLVTQSNVATLNGGSYEILSVQFGLMVILLLLALLVLREMVRHLEGEISQVWLLMLDVVTAPLFASLALTILIRGAIFITVI